MWPLSGGPSLVIVPCNTADPITKTMTNVNISPSRITVFHFNPHIHWGCLLFNISSICKIQPLGVNFCSLVIDHSYKTIPSRVSSFNPSQLRFASWGIRIYHKHSISFLQILCRKESLLSGGNLRQVLPHPSMPHMTNEFLDSPPAIARIEMIAVHAVKCQLTTHLANQEMVLSEHRFIVVISAKCSERSGIHQTLNSYKHRLKFLISYVSIQQYCRNCSLSSFDHAFKYSTEMRSSKWIPVPRNSTIRSHPLYQLWVDLLH